MSLDKLFNFSGFECPYWNDNSSSASWHMGRKVVAPLTKHFLDPFLGYIVPPPYNHYEEMGPDDFSEDFLLWNVILTWWTQVCLSKGVCVFERSMNILTFRETRYSR